MCDLQLYVMSKKSFNKHKEISFGKDSHVLYDIKYLLKANQSDGRL